MILHTGLGNLEGSLTLPSDVSRPVPAVLIIAGSGPTDRNGNQGGMESRAYRQLADSLQARGIACLRYDKRGVGQSDRGVDSPSEIRFEHFVDDAAGWIDLLVNDRRFSHVIVAGHSEGSLVGMLATLKSPKAAAYISIAGAGRPIDEVLKDQLSGVVEPTRGVMYGIIDKLKQGDTVSNIPPLLGMLFRIDVQPFLISWFRYNPQKEITKLKQPILILQGGTDVQVKPVEAELLAKAAPNGRLILIPDMNHVLKRCTITDKKEQMKLYYDNPTEPIHTELVQAIGAFTWETVAVKKRGNKK